MYHYSRTKFHFVYELHTSNPIHVYGSNGSNQHLTNKKYLRNSVLGSFSSHRTKAGLLFNDDVHQLWQGSSGVVLVGLSGSSTHLRSQISSGIEAKSLQKNVISSSENHKNPKCVSFPLKSMKQNVFPREVPLFFLAPLEKHGKASISVPEGVASPLQKVRFCPPSPDKRRPKKVGGDIFMTWWIRWRGYHGYIRGDP